MLSIVSNIYSVTAILNRIIQVSAPKNENRKLYEPSTDIIGKVSSKFTGNENCSIFNSLTSGVSSNSGSIVFSIGYNSIVLVPKSSVFL